MNQLAPGFAPRVALDFDVNAKVSRTSFSPPGSGALPLLASLSPECVMIDQAVASASSEISTS